MKKILLVPLALASTAMLSGCIVPGPRGPVVVAPPAPVVVAPAPVYEQPPVYAPSPVVVAPTYGIPGDGFLWRFNPRYGWGWYHPRRGWHRRWR